MTDQNNAAQAELREALNLLADHEKALTYVKSKGHDTDKAERCVQAAQERVDALLSKLRAEGVQADDERAAFEAWFTEKAKTLPLLKNESVFRYAGGQYVSDWALFGWMVWGTRAALASAPVPPAEVLDALNWLDDFVARCNGDDRGVCESVNLLRRALASAPATCAHQFHFFGEQKERRCNRCNALDSKASAPVACNCPGGNKPADLHAPNCPIRVAKASLLDPYDGGTWVASAPVADGWQPIKTAPQGVRVLFGPRHAPVVGIVKHYEDADGDEPDIVCNVVHYNDTVLVADYRCSEWAPLASAPVANALTQQDVFDRFQFLEGLVNANTYRKIAETAHALYESGAPWPNMEQTIRDLRAELGYVKQYGPRVLPDLCPPATSRDRWMYEQGRLAERASAAVDAEAEDGDFLVRLFAELDTWRAEDWNELIERRPAILALLRPLVLASAPVADERAAFEVEYAKELCARGTPPTFAAFLRNPDDSYALPIVERAWAMWQARAALASVPVADTQLPVRYYKDGGTTHAVYGSSSITYVEKLRAALASAPVAGERFEREALRRDERLREASSTFLNAYRARYGGIYGQIKKHAPLQDQVLALVFASREAPPSDDAAPQASEAQKPIGYVAEWGATSKVDGHFLVVHRSRITDKHQAEITAKQWSDKSPDYGPMRATAVYAAPQVSASLEFAANECERCAQSMAGLLSSELIPAVRVMLSQAKRFRAMSQGLPCPEDATWR
jgi:hypothetical protein